MSWKKNNEKKAELKAEEKGRGNGNSRVNLSRPAVWRGIPYLAAIVVVRKHRSFSLEHVLCSDHVQYVLHITVDAVHGLHHCLERTKLLQEKINPELQISSIFHKKKRRARSGFHMQTIVLDQNSLTSFETKIC